VLARSLPDILAPVGASETTRLLLDAIDGEPDARGFLLERLRPRIVLWLTARMSPKLRARVDPEDVAQQVLWEVHKGLDGFQGREPRRFLSWVFTIADHQIKDEADYHGAQKRQRRPLQTFTQTSPSLMAARKEQIVEVREAIEELPEDYREVIRLRRLEELDYELVAELMGRQSTNAVRVLYCRALKALAEILKKRRPLD
jgi:RNA polymerase sigma-70 factor (ECF subfamily)